MVALRIETIIPLIKCQTSVLMGQTITFSIAPRLLKLNIVATCSTLYALYGIRDDTLSHQPFEIILLP